MQMIRLGTGRETKLGDLVSVHFRAWVIKDSTNIYKDWSKDSTRQAATIGSSIDFGQPVKFKLGDSAFIKGVDEAIVGMKIGGTRTIIIPSNKAYGELGFGPVPPNSSFKSGNKFNGCKGILLLQNHGILILPKLSHPKAD
ncbi:MAG: FKBP-type peptidyl-prolyl cis-trans isomerase [Ignavibacteriales bacterium]|nr:FKBP-type peptidyl-prolyl cis-trans isomerase [Ignavibacteriales bacterium]